MSDKEIYRNHCEQNMNIPLFLSFAWINTVCKENEWDVILKLGGNDVHGFLVYHKKKKLGQNYITMPPLTPYTGVWINYPEHQKQTTRISFERKVMEFLISRLPKFDFCVMHLHPYISNWQPFYWNNFQQTTRYTYILDNKEEEDLYNG